MKPLQEILDNRNDLIEGTYCYRLFGEGVFDEEMLMELIGKIEYAANHGLLTDQVCETIHWIIDCVDRIFIYHHDKDDLYTISNYTPEIDTKWEQVWKKQIKSIM